MDVNNGVLVSVNWKTV